MPDNWSTIVYDQLLTGDFLIQILKEARLATRDVNYKTKQAAYTAHWCAYTYILYIKNFQYVYKVTRALAVSQFTVKVRLNCVPTLYIGRIPCIW